MKMSCMRQKTVRGINLLIFNEWFEKVKCLKMQSAVRSLVMMKNAGYILFMHFNYITAKKIQVQTRMKRQTLQWRICLMRWALGPLNDQLSSLGAVFSASEWVNLVGSMLAVGPGPRGSDNSKLCAGTWPSLPLCVMWDAYTSPVPPDLELTQLLLPPLAPWFSRWRHWCEHPHPGIRVRVWACVGWLTQCPGSGPPQSCFAVRHSFELFCVV